MSLELLPRIRAEVHAEVAALEDLSRGGRFIVSQPSVPGLDGAPEIPLLICTPADAPAPRPVLYYMHGGGFSLQRSPHRARPAASALTGNVTGLAAAGPEPVG
jgi:acetyl esterase/lipase